MKKKSLFLKKEIIADLSRMEMNKVNGGTATFYGDSCTCVIKTLPPSDPEVCYAVESEGIAGCNKTLIRTVCVTCDVPTSGCTTVLIER